MQEKNHGGCMVLTDIKETLHFFKQGGVDIYLGLSQDFSIETRRALSEFALDAELENKGESVLVFYSDKKIAEIAIVGNKEPLIALSTPLKYMLYKLYEETQKFIVEEHDVYGIALQYINEHLTEDISTVDVAKHVNYSESYFGYAFKKKYGVSIGQYIDELRLTESKNLLRNTSFSITGVASFVGFNSPNYFSSLFKKHFGVSPKEYRKMHGRIIK